MSADERHRHLRAEAGFYANRRELVVMTDYDDMLRA